MDKINSLKLQIQDILNKKQDPEISNELDDALYELSLSLQNELKTLINQKDKIESENLDTELNSELNTYLKKDSLKTPAFIFLHESITKQYGVCPYIKTENETESESENRRIEWLKTQHDNGKNYYDLYNKIIKEDELNNLLKEKETIENEIENMINITLSDLQKNTYNEILELTFDYTSAKVKTKKVKEKYNKIIFLCTKLYNETNLNIHEYLNKKVKLNIYIPDPDEEAHGKGNVNMNKFFKIHLEKYSGILNEINTSKKYIKNTKKHLYKSLEIFLKQKEVVKNTIKQQGKYFKKWAELSLDEKFERIQSYASFYSSKNNINQEKLLKFLKESFESKSLKYKDIKWNAALGIVQNINIVYDDKNDNYSINTKEKTTVKKSSVTKSRTLFTKENEEKINELILTFLISNKNLLSNKKEEDKEDKQYKELCFENIKSELTIKNISKSDKIIFDKKYSDIYDIIQKNKK